MISPNDIFQTSTDGGGHIRQVEGGFCLSSLQTLSSQAKAQTVEESNLSNYIEDSHDTYFETDTEDISMPAESQNIQGDAEMYPTSFMMALKKAVNNNTLLPKVENPSVVDPYHIPSARYNLSPTSELITPQKELKNLIKEVELTPSETNEVAIDKLTMEKPYIEVIEQPETTYRARYESEGCKGPIHGASENEFPTVKIVGYVGKVILTVYVVTRDNEPHLHSATGPGSSKVPCKTVFLDDNTTQALQMTMIPSDENDEMTAVFDQLSIRRVRNWEADRELRKRGIDPSTWKSKKKEAKLAFHVEIYPGKYHSAFSITEYSRLFLCTAPSGNPEIWWASTGESPPEGGGEIGFIGKKFASGFKVRFYSKDDDGHSWEVYGDVDRAKSNLNACVVRVPPYKDVNLTENVVVHVEIRVGSEKEPRCSDAYPFTYKPSKASDGCENCTQIKDLLHRIYGGENGENASNGNSILLRRPELITQKTLESNCNAQSVAVTNTNSSYPNACTPQKSANQPALHLKDLLQLYKLKTPLNININKKENKPAESSFVFIPKTTVQTPNVYPVQVNNQTTTMNINQNVVPRTLCSTQTNFVTLQDVGSVKASQVTVMNNFANSPRNTITCSSISKSLLTTHLASAPNNVLQDNQMEVSPNADNMPKQTAASFITIPNNTLQFSNNIVPCSIVQTNNSNFGRTLHINQFSDKVKQEQLSPIYHTIAVRNSLPVSNSGSTNQLVYSAVALTPQVSSHLQQQGFAIQQVPQNSAVAFVPTIATQNNQIIVTPLEKEIQMLTNRVQTLKKELESKRQTAFEYNVIQQGNSYVQSHQASNNENTALPLQTNVINQFKNDASIIQSSPALLHSTVQQPQTKPTEHNIQQTQPQVKLIPNQTSFAQLKLVTPSDNFSSVKYDQNGNTYAQAYIQDVTEHYNIDAHNKSIQEENNKIQNNIPSSEYQQPNHEVIPNKMEIRMQPIQTIPTLVNVNPSLVSTQTPAATHPHYFEQIQTAISVENSQTQKTFQNVNALIANEEKSLSNRSEAKKIDSWEQRLSVSEAIASNKVGYKDGTPNMSRPESPMEITNDENNLLKTLQQLNNTGNNNMLSSYKNNISAMNMQASGQYNYDNTKEQLNAMQKESPFLDQNLSVDYSDNFKKATNNQNVISSASWVYHEGEVISYGQPVFVNEDSTSQVW